MLKIENKGYNNFKLSVSELTVSSATVVGDQKTLKQLIAILKNGGKADFETSVSSSKIVLPSALGQTGDLLTLSGICDASGTQTVYTGEFAMGTGADKDKLKLTLHSDTV